MKGCWTVAWLAFALLMRCAPASHQLPAASCDNFVRRPPIGSLACMQVTAGDVRLQSDSAVLCDSIWLNATHGASSTSLHQLARRDPERSPWRVCYVVEALIDGGFFARETR